VIVQTIGQELMARATHPLQIDLRFRDAASKLIDVVIIGPLASNFSGERLDLPIAPGLQKQLDSIHAGARYELRELCRALTLDLCWSEHWHD
jgi:hypothetical protein